MATALLHIKVIPGASENKIVGWLDRQLKIKLKTPPEKGKANEALIALLCEKLHIQKSTIQIVKGHLNAQKIVHIHGYEQDEVNTKIEHTLKPA